MTRQCSLLASRIGRALIALVAGALALGGIATASAQMPPYTAYGIDLRPGDLVWISIEGVECGSTKVSAAGNWIIRIGADAPCQPVDGATVRFAVNGTPHAATVRWSGGGTPLNPRVGVVLGAVPPATLTPTPAKTAIARPTVIPRNVPPPKATVRPSVIVPKARTPFR